MKNTNKCPKCGGHNIISIQNDGHPDGSNGNNIMCGPTIFSGVVFVDRYVCCDCGYSEEWVDTSKMETILKSKKIKRS